MLDEKRFIIMTSKAKRLSEQKPFFTVVAVDVKDRGNKFRVLTCSHTSADTLGNISTVDVVGV
jgi:hypothetical protein